MKVTTERLPESQIVLEIEVDEDRVERSMDWAYRRLAGRTRIPGFRKGKVPRPMLERFLGRDALLREALDNLVPEVYKEALTQESIEPIDQADFEIKSLEPVVFKATVPLAPEIKLGDYKSVRLPAPDINVTKEEIDAVLEDLRHRYATLEPRDGEVRDGDNIRADVKAQVDDEKLMEEEDAQFFVRKGGQASLPGFSDALLGLTKGQHTFTLEMAPDFEEAPLAGKSVRYEVDIKEIKEEKLPDLDDSFARTVGEGFESFKELRTRVESDVLESKTRQEVDAYHEAVLQQIMDAAEIEYPPVLVEREIDRVLHEQTGQQDHQAMENYLRQIGRDEDEIKEEVRPQAIQRIRRSLVLTELAKAEEIEVADASIDAELDSMAGTSPQSERIRETFGSPSGRDILRRSLVTRQTLERVGQIAQQEGGRQAGAPKRARKAAASEEKKAAPRKTTKKTAAKP